MSLSHHDVPQEGAEDDEFGAEDQELEARVRLVLALRGVLE